MASTSQMPRLWAEECSPDLELSDADIGVVPIGAVEQHGPHLPTATDTMIAEWICRQASARTAAVVLPTISVANSQGHGTALPGTLSLGPELLIATIRSYAGWAATSGLRRLLFVNAHLGNSASISVALDNIRFHRPDLRAGAVDWWKSTDDVWNLASADGEDFHANRAETSVMLVIAPHLVKTDRIEQADDPDRTHDLVFRYTAPSLSTNGVTGRPSEADPALGQNLLDRAVEAIALRVERGRAESPPFGQAPPPLI